LKEYKFVVETLGGSQCWWQTEEEEEAKNDVAGDYRRFGLLQIVPTILLRRRRFRIGRI